MLLTYGVQKKKIRATETRAVCQLHQFLNNERLSVTFQETPTNIACEEIDPLGDSHDLNVSILTTTTDKDMNKYHVEIG